jgi:hypothetical protein
MESLKKFGCGVLAIARPYRAQAHGRDFARQRLRFIDRVQGKSAARESLKRHAAHGDNVMIVKTAQSA